MTLKRRQTVFYSDRYKIWRSGPEFDQEVYYLEQTEKRLTDSVNHKGRLNRACQQYSREFLVVVSWVLTFEPYEIAG